MIKFSEIFQNRQEFKEFATDQKFIDAVNSKKGQPEKVILFKKDKTAILMDSEKYDKLIDANSPQLNDFCQFTCIGDDVEVRDYLNAVDYIFSKSKFWN